MLTLTAMKRFLILAVLALVAEGLVGQNAPSLGDIARRIRSEKAGVGRGGSQPQTSSPAVAGLVSTYKEAVTVADHQESAAETKDYFSKTLMPDFGAKFTPVLQSCFAHVSNPDSSAFGFVAAIGSDGRVQRLYKDRETNISQCALDDLNKQVFPQPPAHPYYLHIDMRFPDGGKPEAAETTDGFQNPPLIVKDRYSYTFGVPAGWEYDFHQADQRGALLAFFPNGGSFSRSKNVIYVNEFNNPCQPNCSGRKQQAIDEILKDTSDDAPELKISTGDALTTAEGGTAELRILDGSRDPRGSGEATDREAVAVIEHKEAIVLVILTATDLDHWDQDYKAFQEVVRGHRFFNCHSANLAQPCH